MEVIVPAEVSAGYHAGEVIATLNESCSAFLDVSFVVGAQPTEGPVQSEVRVQLVRTEAGRALVELPGVAIGSLRGWVDVWKDAGKGS